MEQTSYANLSAEELDQIKQFEESMGDKYILIAYNK